MSGTKSTHTHAHPPDSHTHARRHDMGGMHAKIEMCESLCHPAGNTTPPPLFLRDPRAASRWPDRVERFGRRGPARDSIEFTADDATRGRAGALPGGEGGSATSRLPRALTQFPAQIELPLEDRVVCLLGGRGPYHQHGYAGE